MSDLHGQIMNIQVTSAGIGNGVEEGMRLDNDIESKLALAYKIGHRDARHAAAELACAADTRIADLLSILVDLRESAMYWSEYDVPLGIVDRIKAATAEVKGV